MKINQTYTTGEIIHPDETVRHPHDSREQTTLQVKNTGDHIVQIGSHYHFFEANPVLGFDRKAAYGKRLDLPAGDRTYFPPGETMTVTLIPIGGKRRIHSFYGAVDGRLDDYTPEEALDRLQERLYEPLADAPNEENDD